MDFAKYGTWGLIIAAAIPFWTPVKNIFIKLFRIFWKQRIISADFSGEFYKKLYGKSLVCNFDDYDLTCTALFSKKDNQYLPIVFKQYKFEIFFYHNFIPIFLSGAPDGALKIRYLKFTFDFEKFFKLVTEEVHHYAKVKHKERTEDRFYIEEVRGKSLKEYKIQESSKSDSSAPSSNNSKQNDFYTLNPWYSFRHELSRILGHADNDFLWDSPVNQQKNKYQFTEQGKYVLNQVRKWLDAQKWYEERNIPHRRGCLLYGKPGTGKSALVLEIARTLKIPIFIFDVSEMTNEEFCNKISNISSYPSIILFEDFDCAFEKRTSINKSQQYNTLTFDCFINKISGVKSIKNKFIFITTNNIDKIDEALLRDGRIDEKIELKSLNSKERHDMAKTILDDVTDEELSKLVDEGRHNTTAEWENCLIKFALDKLWIQNEQKN